METGKIFANVSKFCHQKLLENEKVLNYLRIDRSLEMDTINKFQIGLFPDDLRELFELIDPKDLRLAGVIKHASKSMFRLQNLVMPIIDVYGNAIAMAGRTLIPEEERSKRKVSKYINSIYDKSHHLYGLNFAKKSILKKNIVYVVEGYFDVIMPHQKGLENFVAICGAFLSTRHIALLSRYTDRIVIMFDNEKEAQERARKIAEKKSRKGISLIVANPFPEGVKDIDEFLRKYTVNDFLSIIKKYENREIKPLWD